MERVEVHHHEQLSIPASCVGSVWSSVGNLCFISQVRAGLRCCCPHTDVKTVVPKAVLFSAKYLVLAFLV